MSTLLRVNHLVLPATATVEEVERDWANLGYDTQPRHLIVDLSQCRFLEVTTLVYLLGRLRGRAKHKLRTTFRLPRPSLVADEDAVDKEKEKEKEAARAVRDILRVWDFPQAVRDVTGTTFKNLVDPDDHEFFGERTGGLTASSDTLPAEFYPIRQLNENRPADDKRIAKEEAERWAADSYVLRVLNRRLLKQGQGLRVSTHIINEGVMNAVRHPRAELIMSASRWDKAGRHLTIVIYDDGETVLDTLAGAVRDGYEVRAGAMPSLERHYLVNYSEVRPNEDDQKLGRYRLSSSYTVTADSSEAEILAAAFMPGVTRDPFRTPDEVDSHPHVVDEDQENARPGMGLAVLLNSVVDVFGGTVSLRAGYHFLNARKAPRGDDADYRMKVVKYPPVTGRFDGNLMTIRLPLGSNA